MALRIGTNLAGLAAAHELERTAWRFARSLERLATGRRAPRAGDDPQGLVRGERAEARLRSLDAALRSAAGALDLARAVDGALGQVSEVAVRLRELALAAANGTLASSDRAGLDRERLSLADELSRLAGSTRFDGVDLLGEQRSLRLQIGPDAGDALPLDLLDFRPVGPVFAAYSLADEEGRGKVHEYAGLLLDFVLGLRGFAGALESRLGSIVRGLESARDALAVELAHVRDADLAHEASEVARERLRLELGALVLAQANVDHAVALRLLEGLPAPSAREPEQDGPRARERG